MVVWLTGLSGSGKSTLAKEVYAQAQNDVENLVLLDGDILRDVFGGDLGHSVSDRKRNSDRICGVCKLLDDQGFHVVCAILSIFSESRSWNRTNLSSYYEVFIDASFESLVARDAKGLYRAALAGKERDVVGVDIPFAPPSEPDLIIENNGGKEDLLSYAPKISELIRECARGLSV